MDTYHQLAECTIEGILDVFEEVSDDDDEGFGMTFGEKKCVYNLPQKPTAQWFDPLPADYFKTMPRGGSGAGGSSSGAGAGSAPAWDSQLSSAGWRGWPVVPAGVARRRGGLCGTTPRLRTHVQGPAADQAAPGGQPGRSHTRRLAMAVGPA